MPFVERMEFPQKRPLKQALILIAIIAAAFGIWLQNRSQDSLVKNIIITNPQIIQITSSYLELSYEIESKLLSDKEIRLLCVVYDENGEEIASSVFMVNARAGTKQTRSRILDKLVRSPKEGETFQDIRINIIKRKVF